MSQPDYHGARGSNAGDDFHELWALRQALALLDPESGLRAVTVEGLRAEDEDGKPLDTWDGVDCTLYYGGDHAATATRIVIAQLKYSAANPEQLWTVARLTHSTNKKQDNSVIGRLAKAFAGLKHKRPDLVASGNVLVRLVSNQQVDSAVVDALSADGTAARAALLAASGLQEQDFERIATDLDLSECGHGSRFGLEERILATISEWTDDDARAAVNDLMSFLRRKMMPEATGEVITRQSILLRLGFSDAGALFPCPPALKRIDQLISRAVSRTVVERMTGESQRICLHGEGGCGKTTALQEIEALLPDGSVVIVFDCYGNGRYLNSDAYRHRVADAFLQISNELASQLRIPLLLSPSKNLDYPKVVKKRLTRAAEVTSSRAPGALLVVIVDAADNSLIAASTRSPPETSFVSDFLNIGDLPKNVRFLVTARTGRLPLVNLPHNFEQVEIKGFALAETALNVQQLWTDALDSWIEDFHHLSGGNPRVQQYALDYAGREPARALDYLRPSGKNLDEIFRVKLEFARQKVGLDQDIKLFCAGLVALPRPIPLTDLAAVTELNPAHVRDLCADLAPGVRLTNDFIGFSDEDFEHFVRVEAEAHLAPVQTRIADYFLGRHASDAYAAAHVAAVLLAAGRGREILDLVNAECEPKAIDDPILRRATQLERLRLAMKVCRETGDNVDAMLTLLIGAEALKTDTVLRRTLVENPDLATNFARDNVSKMILRDPDQIENHGSLLFHLLAADARRDDRISVREGNRHLRAWLERRRERFEEQKREHTTSQPHGWSIDDRDIAAQIEATLRIADPQRAVEHLRSWRPTSIGLRVGLILSRQLSTSGETSLIWRCITEAGIQEPWNLFLLTPLALAGEDIDISRLERGLARLLRRGLISVDRLTRSLRDDGEICDYFDTILTACEIVVARGGNHARIVTVLEQFTKPEIRRRDQLYTSQVSVIDLTLRAHALLEQLAGRETTLDTYLVDPPEPSRDLPTKKVEDLKRANNEKKEELDSFIKPLIKLYDVRAGALVGSIPRHTAAAEIQAAISHYQDQEYRIRRQYDVPPMRTRAALSMTRLTFLPGIDRAVIFECAIACLGARPDPLGSTEAQIFASLALDRSLHEIILSKATQRAKIVRELRTSAQDKVQALIQLARLLLPISFADSNALFNQAIEVAGEIDEEAIHEISLFAPLAARAVTVMHLNPRREVARDFAIVVTDVAVRLKDHDHFPWTQVAEALATLDLPLALAALGRWEDAGVVDRGTFLPSILETGLTRHELSPAQAAALLSLLDQVDANLIEFMVTHADKLKGNLDLNRFSEELAKNELLRFGHGTRKKVFEKLNSLSMTDRRGFWFERLMQATNFHQLQKVSQTSAADSSEDSLQDGKHETEHRDPCGVVNWCAYRFVSVRDVLEVIHLVTNAARSSKNYVGRSTIFDRIRSVVALSDRRAHLDALADFASSTVSDYELADAIAKAVLEWRETPSVDEWCKGCLRSVLVNQLPGFSLFLPFDRRLLPDLLEKSGLSDQQIAATLIEGLERHVDAFHAQTIYALVGIVGQYCLPSEAAQVLERYANRLLHRIVPSDREKWEIVDIPKTVLESMCRLIYALMGDVDVRTRWRAAHFIRSLVRLGDHGFVDSLLHLYDRTSEESYRSPIAPFYWLAARLWLIITLDRISDETPLSLKGHGQRLLEIASDDNFPHILVRSFAKSAASKLIAAGVMHVNPIQRKALKRANTSQIPGRKARTPYYKVGFDRYHYRQSDDRRFHFDTMDTLPYWYSFAMRRFADLDGENFLDTAERWIVDCWGVKNNPWQWDQEPRKERLSDRSISAWHSHGSLPILERFHTYLEWHAMWCATGELMQRHSLVKVEKGDYDTFEHWLSSQGLTGSPQWLSDLRGPKPLESRFWFKPPGDIDAWIEGVGDSDFLIELGLLNGNETMVVEGHYETRCCDFTLSSQVRSALVSGDTALPLVRALQTVDDSWDYHMPLAGDDSEIDVSPYKLKGWIIDDRHDLGIDERDPFRYEIRGLEYCPSSQTAKVLNLEFVRDRCPRWVDVRCRDTVFTYEAWSDNRGDEGEDRRRYDRTVRSAGARLLCDKKILQAFMDKTGVDLIVEIEITRKTTDDEYSRYDKKEAKEARFDRVVLLRNDGTIEAAEGCLGTWTAPRT